MGIMEPAITSTISTEPIHQTSFRIPVETPRARTIYHVRLEKGSDGWIVAKCTDIKGAISQGKTKDEALRNIVEAIAVILEDIYEGQQPEFSIIWEEK